MTNPYPNMSKVTCKWCEKLYFNCFIERHEISCWLHPDNIKLCPVCGAPSRKGNETCSNSCSNTHNRSGTNHPNWKYGGNYRKVCFEAHGHKCLICDETNIIEVHHIDHNRLNNAVDNLVPLCPTHHAYWHSGFKSLIEVQISTYLKISGYSSSGRASRSGREGCTFKSCYPDCRFPLMGHLMGLDAALAMR